MQRHRVWISIGIVLLIALHAVPVVNAKYRKRMWPILEWAMYKDSRAPGPILVNKKRIVAVTAKGQEEAVTPHLLGSSPYALQTLYERPMWKNDSSAAEKLFQRLNLEREDPFVELRMESETHTVTDTGIVKRENPVITYRAGPSPSR